MSNGLSILGITKRGTPHEEYVHLHATRPCNLAAFLVADTTFSGLLVSNKDRHSHWFSSKLVAANDHVFLFTGTGTNSSFANQAGSTTHRIYWGMKTPIWNNTGDEALLFSLNGPPERHK